MKLYMILFCLMFIFAMGCSNDDSQLIGEIDFTIVGINDDQFLVEIEENKYWTEDSSTLRMLKLKSLLDMNLNLPKTENIIKPIVFRRVTKNEDLQNPFIVHLENEDLRVVPASH